MRPKLQKQSTNAEANACKLNYPVRKAHRDIPKRSGISDPSFRNKAYV